MNNLKILLELALDLNASMNTEDRYLRFLHIIRKIIPYDAATLMRLDQETLVPLASVGLSPKAMTKVYPLKEHPRLDIICKSEIPTLFPPDSELEDPFDGYLLEEPDVFAHIHACLGCPLIVEGKLTGVLTADAVRSNAFDHLDHYFLETLGALAGNAVRLSSLLEQFEKRAQKEHLVAKELMKTASQRSGTQMIGHGSKTTQLKKEIELVARSDFSVLITGETGVGKELVARAIHEKSPREEKPLIYLNCAALPDNLAESELFGHVKGSFTGAEANRVGKFELADGGTLFLDEIGELSLLLQSKILRTLQEGEIQRIGADRLIKVDVRILAATNRDLKREVDVGNFRADLFHRLNVFPIHVPPLRERLEDLGALTDFFCQKIGRKLGIKQAIVSPETLQKLQEYSWPGNIRELKNVLSRTLLKSLQQSPNQSVLFLSPEDFFPEFASQERTTKIKLSKGVPEKMVPLNALVEQFKKEIILKTVAECQNNWTLASQKLGMDKSNLHHLAKRLSLK